MPLEPSSNFTQASTWARLGNAVFFEVGIFILFQCLDFQLILYFAIKYRRRRE
jgi:hypothetical protein